MAVVLVSIPLEISICFIFYVLYNVFINIGGMKVYVASCFSIWLLAIVGFYFGVGINELKECETAQVEGWLTLLTGALIIIIPTAVLTLLFGVPAIATGVLIAVKRESKEKVKQIRLEEEKLRFLKEASRGKEKRK